MRLHCAAIAFVLSIFPRLAAAAPPEFPYRAYITSDEVYIRSGPGQDYYPTDKLNTGNVVEVYRHDPGGWYAIRPPKGSFSWVSAKFLEMGKDGLATVTGDRVAARVGSRFSEIRDVIQVRLERGELIEVLDAGRPAAGEQTDPWCKIAPPSGEFRWVYGKYVDPDFPADGVRKTAGARGPLVRRAADAEASDDEEGAALARGAARIGASDGDASEVESARHAAPASRARRRAPDRAGQDEPAAGARRSSPEEFQEELEDLDLRLSMMVVEEPTVWEFDGLARRGESLVAQAQTAVERGRARALVNRIARFAEIKRQYDEVAASRRPKDLSAAAASVSGPAAVPGAPHVLAPASEAAGRFDGVGRLTRVASPKVGAPTYALLNEQGEVACYVTPAPGINLRAFEGKRIGVNGVTGLMLDPRAKHVAVKHVAALEDRRMR